jgi:hypothetical protein
MFTAIVVAQIRAVPVSAKARSTSAREPSVA